MFSNTKTPIKKQSMFDHSSRKRWTRERTTTDKSHSLWTSRASKSVRESKDFFPNMIKFKVGAISGWSGLNRPTHTHQSMVRSVHLLFSPSIQMTTLRATGCTWTEATKNHTWLQTKPIRFGTVDWSARMLIDMVRKIQKRTFGFSIILNIEMTKRKQNIIKIIIFNTDWWICYFD